MAAKQRQGRRKQGSSQGRQPVLKGGGRDRRARRGDVLERVGTLARNLWWTWNPDPQRLFAGLDPVLWEATNRNPIATLTHLSAARRAAVEEDRAFGELLEQCERQLRDYLRARTWFAGSRQGRGKLRVAYFCAEFALHESLPIYSGGLGVLAGDHLKSASDLGIPLVGVGLLYRNGYYRQELRPDGSTRVLYPEHDFSLLPVNDTGATVDVPMGSHDVTARVWRVDVGRVPLYLLDADIKDNKRADRQITQRLYGGDNEMRIRQEILLGVGGVRALEAVDERVNTFHLNEGHAAFCNLERLAGLRATGMTLERALTKVRATSVFTTHTPVPAGHDRFDAKLVMKYFKPRLDELGTTRDELLALGRENRRDRREPFCMTVLALRLSERCNGVSKLHGQVSREMWTGVYNTDEPRRVPIGHITNGVHSETWLAPEIRPLYDRYLKPKWVGAKPTDDWWRRADRIPAEELWAMRCLLRRKLVHFIRHRLRQQIERRCEPVGELTAALDTFDADTLTLGFARRFATYKRAPLIFHQAKRLAGLLNHAERPMQIVFAGKAHPADAAGQQYAQRIYQMARKNGFCGRVVLLEDYDMHIGRMLTSGVDVWLNNPIKPQEASGTSGMKPPLHGGLNCSILDGWWPEAYDAGRNGWAIGNGDAGRRRGKSEAARDRADAEALYRLLEHEIAPLFYLRNRAGVPTRWVNKMVQSMKSVCGRFNTHRMLAEYVDLYTGEG